MSETVRRTLIVTDPTGLHVRTALAIANIAGHCQSRISLFKDDRRVEATDVLQIMSMTVQSGEPVDLEVVGPDASAVFERIEPLLAGKFGNEERQESSKKPW